MGLREDLLDQVLIDEQTGCWLWEGKCNNAGYGRLGRQFVHRLAYEVWIGPIPEGVKVDHVCNVRKCLNPLHLRLATTSQNTRWAIRRSRGQMPWKDLRVARMLHDAIDFG